MSERDLLGPVLREQIVVAARDLKGTKYAKCGYSEHAVDCFGVLYFVSKRVAGISDIPPLQYSRGFTEQWFREQFYALFDKRGLNWTLPGSTICFRQSAGPIHCGITTIKHGQPYIVHSSVRDRKVVEQPLSFFPVSQIVEIADFYPAG